MLLQVVPVDSPIVVKAFEQGKVWVLEHELHEACLIEPRVQDQGDYASSKPRFSGVLLVYASRESKGR